MLSVVLTGSARCRRWSATRCSAPSPTAPRCGSAGGCRGSSAALVGGAVAGGALPGGQVGDGCARLVRCAGDPERHARGGHRDRPRPGAGRAHVAWSAACSRSPRPSACVAGIGIAAATGSIAAGYLATAACWSCSPCRTSSAPATSRSADPWPRAVRRTPVRAVVLGLAAQHPDFAWAWLTRFLVNLGNALGLLYLLYYLQDVVGFGADEAEDGVFLLTATYAAVHGAHHRRGRHLVRPRGRRKVFVIWSGLVAAAALLLLASSRPGPAAVVGAVVMGIGFGIYTSVDFALITQVLPAAEDRAKDLGVINIANALPQVLAPEIAAPCPAGRAAVRRGELSTERRLSVAGYFAVYAVAFVRASSARCLVTRHPLGRLTATEDRRAHRSDVVLRLAVARPARRRLQRTPPWTRVALAVAEPCRRHASRAGYPGRRLAMAARARRGGRAGRARSRGSPGRRGGR